MDEDLYVFLIRKALTLKEAADELGVSPNQLVGLVADGTLVAINVGRGSERRSLRIPARSIEDFVEERTVRPDATPQPRRLLRRVVKQHRIAEDGFVARRDERRATRAAKAAKKEIS